MEKVTNNLLWNGIFNKGIPTLKICKMSQKNNSSLNVGIAMAKNGHRRNRIFIVGIPTLNVGKNITAMKEYHK